jgi:hypothetical protein
VPRHFGYGAYPHHGDHFSCSPGFFAGGSLTHLEPRHLHSPCFTHHGSCPTQPNGKVKRNVKTSSGHMVKCWIPDIYLTNPSTMPSTSSHLM